MILLIACNSRCFLSVEWSFWWGRDSTTGPLPMFGHEIALWSQLQGFMDLSIFLPCGASTAHSIIS